MYIHKHEEQKNTYERRNKQQQQIYIAYRSNIQMVQYRRQMLVVPLDIFLHERNSAQRYTEQFISTVIHFKLSPSSSSTTSSSHTLLISLPRFFLGFPEKWNKCDSTFSRHEEYHSKRKTCALEQCK